MKEYHFFSIFEGDVIPDTMIVVTYSDMINKIIQKISRFHHPINMDDTGVTIMVFDKSTRRWSIRMINGTEHLSALKKSPRPLL